MSLWCLHLIYFEMGVLLTEDLCTPISLHWIPSYIMGRFSVGNIPPDGGFYPASRLHLDCFNIFIVHICYMISLVFSSLITPDLPGPLSFPFLSFSTNIGTRSQHSELYGKIGLLTQQLLWHHWILYPWMFRV